MLHEQIRNHLQQNGHFAAGLRLLAMTGEQPQLLAQLNQYLAGQWVPDTAKAQLRAALMAYLKANPAPIPQFPNSPIPNPQSPNSPIPQFPNSPIPQSPNSPIPQSPNSPIPNSIRSLKATAKQLHKRHSDLKGRLNLMSEDADNYPDEQRAQVAGEIMLEVIPALDDIYDQIRHWEKTGEAPPPPNERSIVQETVEKMNRLNKILPPRISKLKRYIREKKRDGKELTDAEVMDYQKELVEKETEVERLKMELGI